MNTALLLEAAIRTLLMGAITWVVLQGLRIDQIRARRTAWLFALGGALLMPLLVAAHIGPRILPEFTRAQPAELSAESGLAAAVPVYKRATRASEWTQTSESVKPEIITVEASHLRASLQQHASLKQQVARIALNGYIVATSLLLLRLGLGLVLALRLKWRAQRIDVQALVNADLSADVRVSAQLANPVTITSSILLPRNYLQWDATTLRIVLSHEFAHVRQKDFYVQLLAGMHCALFWFNPFSWWLQRQLSDLGEALSDHAAAQQADSRVSYAEILLSFAARGGLPTAGVAMARSSNLTPRIERLLNERGFERSFSARPRLPIAAAGIVMMALIASTSVKRVDAAAAAPAIGAADLTVTPPTQETPQQPLEAAPWPDAPPAPDEPAPPPKKPPPAKPVRPIPPLIASAPVLRVASVAPTPPVAPVPAVPLVAAVPPLPAVPPVPPVPPELTAKGDSSLGTWVEINDGGVAYMKIDKDEAFLVKLGDSRIMFNRDFKNRFGKQMPNVDGDFILYQRQGKPYLIQDRAIMDKAQELFAPLKDNQLRQEAEHAQLRANLAQHRRVLREAQAETKISAPEFRAAMEEVSKQLDQLKAEKVSLTLDQGTMISLQNKLASIQGRLGELQAELAMQSGSQGLANEQLAQLQAQESEHRAYTNQKIIDDAQRDLKPLIEQAIKDGRAKPVN